jgi:hypothetical protein
MFMGLDWFTIAVEAVGITILITWTIVPIQEFRLIARRLRHERPHQEETSGGGEPRS